MIIKLKKTKPGPLQDFPSTNSNNNFEQKTIPELVSVLRGTCQFDTYDTIEGVLVNKDKRLRTEIQLLQRKFEFEKLQLQEKLQMEELRGKRAQESYEKLLKEMKAGLAYRDIHTIKELKKKNGELECEVKNLKDKCDDHSNKFDVMRTKNAELESEVLELKKMNEKLVEDSNELDVMRRKNAELESEVLELRKMTCELENQVSELIKLNEKLVEDNKALDELRGKVRVLEGGKNALVAELKIQIAELDERVKNHLETISAFREVNSKLADEYNSLWTKYRQLQERELKLKEDTEHLMNIDASGGNNELEPRANPMVADSVDLTVEDVLVNVFGHDTVEATPLQRNEDVHDALGVSAGTQPRNIGGNDAQGASSASGRVKLGKDSEIIIHDGDRSVSQRVHGKKTIIGLAAVKDAYPSSSVATQQKSKFTDAVVDTAKRKFSFPDIDTSSDDSSDDDSFFDNLPISSALSQGKKTKM